MADDLLRQKTHNTGFTMIEVMIVVAIIGIASAIAAPNYLLWHSRSELRQGITEVQNQLLLARMAALSRNAPVTVAISLVNGTVQTTTTNAATGAQGLGSSLRLPHVVDLRVGPSAAWTSVVAPATATVSFNSMGMRSGGPGPTLNQELAMVNDKGVQFAMKVTPRGVVNWCPDTVCL
ncbi:MAG TPA: GspH/FimT family pseudopilin [Nitrospiraceae bacterium]|nr:GspH/FimT family pseudopilin [Nitrospiraceae bacterium]